MKRDNFGYISNRGASKYFGVSWHWLKDKTNEQDTRWRVSMGINGKTTNLTSDNHNNPLSEQECAVVASFIRDFGVISNRFTVSYHNRLNTPAKNLIVNMKTGTIRRI